MKKILFILSLILIILGFYILSNLNVHIDFPFEKEDIKNVEVYYHENFKNSKKKIITKKKDIDYAYDTLSKLKLKKGDLEDFNGGFEIGLRFNIENEDSYEIVYKPQYVKKGYLITKDAIFITTGDLSGLYKNFKYPKNTVEKSEIPGYSQCGN